MGGLLGGPKGMLAPPLKLLGGAWPPLALPLPTPMLKQLNSSKSMGPDNFHPRFLKETVDSIAYPITLLFNKSLSEGKLPQDWKSVNITCIFKSGDKTKASNYRPSIHVYCVECLKTLSKQL